MAIAQLGERQTEVYFGSVITLLVLIKDLGYLEVMCSIHIWHRMCYQEMVNRSISFWSPEIVEREGEQVEERGDRADQR